MMKIGLKNWKLNLVMSEKHIEKCYLLIISLASLLEKNNFVYHGSSYT